MDLSAIVSSQRILRRLGRGRIIGSLTLFTLLFILVIPLAEPALSELFGPYDDGECEECHTGFEPFLVQVDSPSEVPVGYEFYYGLLVQNPWAHDLNDVILTVDLSGSPGIGPKDPSTLEPVQIRTEGTAPAGGSTFDSFMVEGQVNEVRIEMDWNRPLLFISDLDLTLSGPAGDWSETGDDQIIIPGDQFNTDTYGEYFWTVSNSAPARSISFTLDILIDHNDDNSEVTASIDHIGSRDSMIISVPLLSRYKSENMISYTLHATASYDHPEDGVDEDVYSTTGTSSIMVGNDLVYSRPSEKVTLSMTLWGMGRILGFLTVALFLASFATGGSILKIKRWIDGKTGDRVRWHCVISFTVMISAVVHLLVLYLGFYSNTYKGLFTGGIPLVMMIIVGITGYKRSLLVSRIGDKNWRRMHFWLSIAVILFFLFHAVTEGTDLSFLRWW